MKIIVTCGPSFEPIDMVRRLTNPSTGELGVLLSDTLARAGHRVFCLKGTGATWPNPGSDCTVLPFGTNTELLQHLTEIAQDGDFAALFHVAALCDFRVKNINDHSGTPADQSKISSRTQGLTLELEPAPKIISQLRDLFPKTRIVGWKFELNGSREDALPKAWRQITENRTDACVLNGRAYGPGFGFCLPPNRIQHIPDKPALAQFLTDWLEC